jgi:succinate-acetate transporter protein
METLDQRRGGTMRKFFESGLAFMLVALVSIAVGLLSGRPVLGAFGVFWLVLAIAVRARSTKKQPPTHESRRKDDAT